MIVYGNLRRFNFCFGNNGIFGDELVVYSFESVGEVFKSVRNDKVSSFYGFVFGVGSFYVGVSY